MVTIHPFAYRQYSTDRIYSHLTIRGYPHQFAVIGRQEKRGLEGKAKRSEGQGGRAAMWKNIGVDGQGFCVCAFQAWSRLSLWTTENAGVGARPRAATGNSGRGRRIVGTGSGGTRR